MLGTDQLEFDVGFGFVPRIRPASQRQSQRSEFSNECTVNEATSIVEVSQIESRRGLRLPSRRSVEREERSASSRSLAASL